MLSNIYANATHKHLAVTPLTLRNAYTCRKSEREREREREKERERERERERDA
jgi:hypothetical protein